MHRDGKAVVGHLFLQQGRGTARSSGSPSWAAGGPGRGGLCGPRGRLAQSMAEPQLPLPWLSGSWVQRSRSGCPMSQDPFQVSFSPPSVLIPPGTAGNHTGKIRTWSPTNTAQRASPSSANERVGQRGASRCHQRDPPPLGSMP